jgi:hypothetical protein
MLNPDTAVDRLEVTPPEKVAVMVSGTLIMTTPEPPSAAELAVPDDPPPPPPPVLTLPFVAAAPL